MALSHVDDSTLIASPRNPVVSRVGELIDIDPRSELIFETPPPDVVNSINECFEEFNSTFKKRQDTSDRKHSSDSDSGESLFVTQSVTKATHIKRRLRSFKRPESICDDSDDERERVGESILSENQDTEYEEGNGCASSRKKEKSDFYVSSQKVTFPFLLKSFRRQSLPMRKHQILENSEIGGFLRCIQKIEEGCVNTGRAFSPHMLESEISDDCEDGDHNSDHEVIMVDRNTFVPGFFKRNKLKWLPESTMKSRIQESKLLKASGKEKMKKTTSTKKNKASGSVKKAKKNRRDKASVMTSPESTDVSFSKEQDKQQEILALCSDVELSDFSYSEEPLKRQVVQCVENSHGDHVVVIEETQRNSVEEVADASDHMEHEDDGNSSNQPDNFHLNKSNFVLPPQEGDITIQNDETDSDIVSVDLFGPLDSPKHNQIPKAASITANMEESDEDSDVTQIETDDQFVSPFGLETRRWFEGDSRANEDNDSDETQIVANHSPGPLSKREKKVQHKNKKQTMLRSYNNIEVAGVEETVNVQPSSKHLPLSDEPLREFYSSSSKSVIVGRQKLMVEMETGSPLFKNNGPSFLKRKKKRKEKKGAADLIQSDANVDVGQIVSCEASDVEVTVLKTTHTENIESCEGQNKRANGEQTGASGLQSEETAEVLDENVLSTVTDNSVVTKVKRKKKKHKLRECADAEMSFQMGQFGDSQTPELMSKKAKKKRKNKERIAEENIAADITLNGSFDSESPAELRVNEMNQSSETPQTDHHKHMQMSEDITGCLSPSARRLTKKKKRDRADEPLYESIDMDTCASPFDAGLKIVEQQEDRVSEEEHVNEHLKVAKFKKKQLKASFQVNDITEPENQRSDSHSKSSAEVANFGSEGMVVKTHKKKKRKLKEQNSSELASDIDNNVQYSELQTMDSLSKRSEKTKAKKDKKRTTVGSSDELLGHMDVGLPEVGENYAYETNQLEHSQTSEEMTRLSARKKKKKKRDGSQKHQYESVNLNDDVTGLNGAAKEGQKTTQKQTEERLRDDMGAESLESNASKILKISKHKKKHHNVSSLSQIDEIVMTESTASDLESGNTAELVETINSSVLSNSMYNSKRKKKKQKLKEQENAEPVHSVESEQFNESQMTELTTKRRKKKKKDKERTQPTNVEEKGLADIQSNYYLEAPQTHQFEHIQTSDEVTQSKKKKKKKKNYTLCESDLDVSSVSRFNNVTDRSTTQETTDERPSDGADANLNYIYHKKKRKQSLSLNDDSDFSSSTVQVHETATPRRKKKKRSSECVTNGGGELIQESSDLATHFEKSQSPMLKSTEVVSKKPKTKTNKKRNRSHVMDNSAELETEQTMTDSLMQDIATNIQDSTDIRKKKKKRKMDAENNTRK